MRLRHNTPSWARAGAPARQARLYFLSDVHVHFSNLADLGIPETYVRRIEHARTPYDGLAGSIQLLLVVRDGVQEVHCVLEKDASVSPTGHAQE